MTQGQHREHRARPASAAVASAIALCAAVAVAAVAVAASGGGCNSDTGEGDAGDAGAADSAFDGRVDAGDGGGDGDNPAVLGCGVVAPQASCPAIGGWTRETAAAQGGASAAGVDGAGTVYVVYREGTPTRANLRLALKPVVGAWRTELVDGSGRAGPDLSLAVGAQGRVVAAYADAQGGALIVAERRPGGGWTAVTVDRRDRPGIAPAIDVDVAGGIHVGYGTTSGTGQGDELRYAHKPSGGGWSIHTVQRATVVATDLAVDAAGAVHATYFVQTLLPTTLAEVRYARRQPDSSWQISALTTGTDAGSAALAVGQSGGVHVVYSGQAEVYYARRCADGLWTREVVAKTGDRGADTDIALDPSGRVHVIFADRGLRYAVRSAPGLWSGQSVDPADPSVQGAALVVDPPSGVHVVYQDPVSNALRVARRACR